MIWRPAAVDPTAALAGGAMLAWSALSISPWLLFAGLGVLVAAVTTARWPGTAAAVVLVLAAAVTGPSVLSALVTGSLVAVYLVRLEGRPRLSGLAQLATGVAPSVLVTLGAVSLPARPLWWVLGAAVAVPLALWLASSGRPQHKEESGDG